MPEPRPDDFVMTYPCYFLYMESGGLQCNIVDGNTCLCLFTDLDKLKRFHTTMLQMLRKPIDDKLQVGLDTCNTYDDLIGRLKSGVDDLESAGIRHIVIDPVQGQRIIYAPIRDFINYLPRQ